MPNGNFWEILKRQLFAGSSHPQQMCALVSYGRGLDFGHTGLWQFSKISVGAVCGNVCFQVFRNVTFATH